MILVLELLAVLTLGRRIGDEGNSSLHSATPVVLLPGIWFYHGCHSREQGRNAIAPLPKANVKLELS
jgi:hypothetical protein